jgi:hypothetical protein
MRVEAEKPRLAQQPCGYLYRGGKLAAEKLLHHRSGSIQKLEDAFLKLLAKISQLGAD